VTLSEPRRRRVALWLWLLAAFVTWNVVFDREVAVAAIEFTREQIIRYDRGETVRTIEAAFRPRVGDAAMVATAWATLVLAAGGLVIRLTRRPGPPRSS
jgi:hypothetical protein